MKLQYTLIFLLFTSCRIINAAPAIPSGLRIIPYEKHVDLVWQPNTESNLAGYRIYKKSGTAYQYHSTVGKLQNYFYQWYGAQGSIADFKITAFDNLGGESAMTDSVIDTTAAMTDDEFLTMVQRATFRYFWDYAHPTSGLARERNGSGNTVTIGGSGFGIMTIPVGIERGFITREQGAARVYKMLDFLNTKAARFHGVFSHWLNGETGAVIPFSQYDNGGDLVETSFMLQGILAVRQYFNGSDTLEIAIREKSTAIWQAAEFSWYRRVSFSDWLYWHWSPNYGWQMNFKLSGWMEAMICYILGVASPTYAIPAEMYFNGWAGSSSYRNGNTFYGYQLPLGANYGGPLFFAHYSFLGFNPSDKKDRYANYFTQNKNHTLINRAYCIANPKAYLGYNENSWGLTASDDPFGYLAHEPYANDNGTISPTAALSSMPYTPNESIAALKYFYRTYGDKIWGEYGFKDAYNIQQNWFASSYLAIDQGPIVVMIENYRSKLLWNNFMTNPEIQTALDTLGFVPDYNAVEPANRNVQSYILHSAYPNPFNPSVTVVFSVPVNQNVTVKIYDINGKLVKDLLTGTVKPGQNSVHWDATGNNNSRVVSGVYFYEIKTPDTKVVGKLVLQK